MKTETRTVEVTRISELEHEFQLDPVEAYWTDYGSGRGSVVLTCYGSAWTCYWGGMGEKTIREFFVMADEPYLISKLGITAHLKQRQFDHMYLAKIIRAVKKALADKGAHNVETN